MFFQRKAFLIQLMIRHWNQSPFCWYLLKKLIKTLTLNLMLLPLHEIMGSAWNVLASLGLRWWQHIIVRGLYEHCVAAEYICCRKTILILRISYVHQIVPFLSNCARTQFPIKVAFSVSITSYGYINKFLCIKYFVVSTCELSSRVQIVKG